MSCFKKIWNYQKLLLSSVQLGNIDPTSTPNSSNMGCLPILLLMVMYGFLTYVFNGMNIMFLMIIGIAYTYGIATSKRKLYVLAPVTRRFALFNLYLLPFFIAILTFLVFTVCGVIFVLLLWAAVLIFRIPQDTAPPPADVIASVGGYKTVLFCVIFIVIVMLITITISVIRARKARLISLAIFMTITTGLLVCLKHVLPAIPSTNQITFVSGFDNVLPGFENMAYSGIILTCMAVFLVVIAPLSIKFAYREYMRDKVKKLL